MAKTRRDMCLRRASQRREEERREALLVSGSSSLDPLLQPTNREARALLSLSLATLEARVPRGTGAAHPLLPSWSSGPGPALTLAPAHRLPCCRLAACKQRARITCVPLRLCDPFTLSRSCE